MSERAEARKGMSSKEMPNKGTFVLGHPARAIGIKMDIRSDFVAYIVAGAVLVAPACGGTSDTPAAAVSGNAGATGTSGGVGPTSGTTGGSSGSGASGGSGTSGAVSPLPSDDGSAPSGQTGSPVDDGGAPVDAYAPPTDAKAVTPDTGPPQMGDGGAGWDQVPVILSRIVPPTFPNLDCDITKYGGVANGTTDNTVAFAAAIKDCAMRGGGRVVVPSGTFFTGPIELESNINLYVATGATILFSTDATKYLPKVEVSWEGSFAMNYHPLIWAHDKTNVAITGGGTIDGNASQSNWYSWLAQQQPSQLQLRTDNANGVALAQRNNYSFLRPGLIEFLRCQNVLFDGFTAKNSPFWTVHPVLSTNITARNFHCQAPVNVVNTDGFDPESCTDVLIDHAMIDVGDDAIAIKAGRNRDATALYKKPSENIVIRNSTMLSRWGAITIGSEMSAGVRNVYVENSTFGNANTNLHYGFFIKSTSKRGGYMENIYARTLTVGTVDTFLYLTGQYRAGTSDVGPTMFTTVSNINIDGAMVARTTQSPFFISGADTTKPATGVHLSNITVAASATPALAGGVSYQDLTATNVVVNGKAFNPPPSAP